MFVVDGNPFFYSHFLFFDQTSLKFYEFFKENVFFITFKYREGLLIGLIRIFILTALPNFLSLKLFETDKSYKYAFAANLLLYLIYAGSRDLTTALTISGNCHNG